MTRRPDPEAIMMLVKEAIGDLTISEADVVLEAVRLFYGIRSGPTTNGDARRMLDRLEEVHPP